MTRLNGTDGVGHRLVVLSHNLFQICLSRHRPYDRGHLKVPRNACAASRGLDRCMPSIVDGQLKRHPLADPL